MSEGQVQAPCSLCGAVKGDCGGTKVQHSALWLPICTGCYGNGVGVSRYAGDVGCAFKINTEEEEEEAVKERRCTRRTR